jgi:hypothetical protein
MVRSIITAAIEAPRSFLIRAKVLFIPVLI